jgi:hypothetical protein
MTPPDFVDLLGMALVLGNELFCTDVEETKTTLIISYSQIGSIRRDLASDYFIINVNVVDWLVYIYIPELDGGVHPTRD